MVSRKTKVFQFVSHTLAGLVRSLSLGQEVWIIMIFLRKQFRLLTVLVTSKGSKWIILEVELSSTGVSRCGRICAETLDPLISGSSYYWQPGGRCERYMLLSWWHNTEGDCANINPGKYIYRQQRYNAIWVSGGIYPRAAVRRSPISVSQSHHSLGSVPLASSRSQLLREFIVRVGVGGKNGSCWGALGLVPT